MRLAMAFNIGHTMEYVQKNKHTLLMVLLLLILLLLLPMF
jgi:hypothetical protein